MASFDFIEELNDASFFQMSDFDTSDGESVASVYSPVKYYEKVPITTEFRLKFLSSSSKDKFKYTLKANLSLPHSTSLKGVYFLSGNILR